VNEEEAREAIQRSVDEVLGQMELPKSELMRRERVRSAIQEILNEQGGGAQAIVHENAPGKFEITITWPA
jgi:glutamine synthetase